MKKCVYFAENQKIPDGGSSLKTGYGFSPDGAWRSQALPTDAIGLLIDDRFLPNKAGLAAACRALEDWRGLIILDFERGRVGSLAELVRSLSGKRLVLSPAYADCARQAVLVGPWQGGMDFISWLAIQRKQFGEIVLDAAPLRLQCVPGGRRSAWAGTLPGPGYPCAGLGCVHFRLGDGSILFWDTKQTLAARLEKAGVPLILFRADWNSLPE